ncbi:neuropeptide F receptor-like [Thrips palmi]|uniref:Neuropeptide F receptor-like n=1 Tax=Thrips palmi TaxID=161013 RepID=A0A6P9AFH8_THRPL|nr:neuropeptide F receptor-like [Thrips palmi]
MNRSSGEGTVLGQGLAHGLGTWPLLSSWAAEDLQDDWGAQDAVTQQVNASPVVTDLQHDGLLELGPGAPWSDADLYPGDAALDTPLLRIALVLLYALLAATGFTSNVLVCCVVARQSMRKTTAGKMIPRHLYIANLAVADVLICLLALPGTLWWLLQGWAASPAVPVVASDGVPQLDGVVDVDGVPRCVSQWPAPAPAWRLSYACVRAVLHFLLPALSLCVVHTRISAYLHSRPMQWRRRRSRRTALVLGTVAAVFTFSWLPLTAFQLLVTNPGQHRVMFACCHLLAMSSTLSNPLLYGWLNSHFRREIRAMLPCCCAPRKERHSRTVCKACRARQERALAKELEVLLM